MARSRRSDARLAADPSRRDCPRGLERDRAAATRARPRPPARRRAARRSRQGARASAVPRRGREGRAPRERRRSRDASTRLVAELEAIAAAADEGLKQHDRWLLARTLLLRKLDGRRSTSRLPELIEYVLSRPLVSAGTIAKELDITPRGAEPRRRAGPARGDGARTISGVGRLVSDHEPALETSPAAPSIRPPDSYAGRGRRPDALSAIRRQRREHRPPAKPQGRHAAAAPARTAAIPDARRRHPRNARSTRHGLPRPGSFDIAGERRGPHRRRPHRRPYARAARSNGCAPTSADWRAAGRSRGRQRQECAVGARPIHGSPAISWRFPPCRCRRSTVPAPPRRRFDRSLHGAAQVETAANAGAV